MKGKIAIRLYFLFLLLLFLSAVFFVDKSRAAVPKISAGNDFSLLLKLDGSLWAWGVNDKGQLGDGDPRQANKNAPVQIGTEKAWTAVSAGWSHSLALKEDGTLWAWGWNVAGELGDGTTIPKTTPIQADSNTWGAISAGFYHSHGLKSDGTLWGWGTNYYGQVGDGTTTDRHTPAQVGSANTWIAVSAGGEHGLGLKSDGTLWAWGRNGWGQLGDGTTTNRSTPVQVGTENNWLAVDAGFEHSLALKSDGTLWAWGRNAYGQLGDGTTTNRSTPVQVGTENNWLAVDAGYEHSLALKSDGTLWAWGAGASGQLGNGYPIYSWYGLLPGNNWVGASAGNLHSLALKADGTIWAWGDNQDGQLGDGTVINKSSPVLIGTFGFIDTPYWAYPNIVSIYSAGLTTGCSQNPLMYCPENNVTREQMAVFITRALNREPANGMCPGVSPFTDVAIDRWSCQYIATIKDLGITTGYGDGRFGPDDEVTREQMAVFLTKALAVVPPGGYCGTTNPFTDVLFDRWSCGYVKKLAELGITAGYGDGRFGPDDNVTRAQMAVFLSRAFLGM